MVMTREYYNNNVDMGVEIEFEEGGRFWEVCKGSEVKDFCNEQIRFGHYISDIDWCCKQSDEKVRHFLNVVFYNCDHNPIFKDKSVFEVLEIALDNWDYK